MSMPVRTEAGAEVRSPLAAEIERRRTFAIISHPDAGKTTLTEKLLLFGGAIQLAGQVKAKRNRKTTQSDWMAIEKERGISVVTSVMTFEYGDHVFNLLDTPGHEDFSEDTYRTLTAVDSAVMVIDAAKGIEARTRKLFEVCRMRDIPILTFINKMDRETRDPFDLLDEIEKTLALDTTPVNWPVGRGRDFTGTIEVQSGGVRLLEGDAGKAGTLREMSILEVAALNPSLDASAIEGEFELVREACKPFDLQAFREGHLSPVFFGSALKNFGVGDLLDALGRFAPPPRDQKADKRVVHAEEPRMSAFVFKIQANMDPNHRDRIAFARLCSGKLTRGMKVKQIRTGKSIALNAPQFFFAKDRSVADEAYAGDVVGIPNHGSVRIGDTLTEGEDLNFVGVPSFAPEILRRVRLPDAMKAKKLKEALQQLAEEGVVQVFRPHDGSPALVGVVGPLQLDVLRVRLMDEYGLEVSWDVSEFTLARWISSDDPKTFDTFVRSNSSSVADDLDGDPVFLARNQFNLDYTRERAPGIAFADIKDVKKAAG
ncbi:peptide chain release factor 3 [Pseudorhodoplanes sinuspersici]|uniref:Peptide chain release factor 3 n=1 Tax=Pseudorhodoplanes sinuspersici TaxID=1235591 RepID=A0A1W6ZXG2_9HYPH|nr:peptide chain release factor 3 [Pseudorhodoplanes sinuspersici]ARQ01821.1 peptide chain release factor 3 [Pseudorhodoplanes sinuspersici]RKE73575.1 peptide chain release factor 3 (bRF-3) [Pseudorhodoplanes sinuspersici]